MSSTTQKVALQVVFVLGILVLAAIITQSLVSLNKPEEKVLENYTPQVVDIQIADFEKTMTTLETRGVVKARTSLSLLPEVSGKITWVADNFEDGGFFLKGSPILTIEKQRYINELTSAKSNLAEAESLYIQEQGHAYVAKKEWEGRLSNDNEAARKLALREPQLAAAKAKMLAAKEAVAAAQLNVKKTTVYAPFDGLLSQKVADKGQFVNVGTQLAHLHAVDAIEVRVPLTSQQLGLLDLPVLGQKIQFPVNLLDDKAVNPTTWKGQLVRTEGILDSKNGVLHAVIEVKDPYGLKTPTPTPLRIGTFVRAELQSKSFENVVTIERKLLRSGNQLWLIDEENRLTQRKVQILPTRGKQVYVYQGLVLGDRIVTSTLTDPVEGRTVILREEGQDGQMANAL